MPPVGRVPKSHRHTTFCGTGDPHPCQGFAEQNSIFTLCFQSPLSLGKLNKQGT